jgi:hypothetical protein
MDPCSVVLCPGVFLLSGIAYRDEVERLNGSNYPEDLADFPHPVLAGIYPAPDRAQA